jgi:tryptophan-rich sensory protein
MPAVVEPDGPASTPPARHIPARSKPNRLLYLLISLVLFLVAVPSLQGGLLGYSLLIIFYTAVVLSGVYAVDYSKRGLMVAVSLALLVTIATWSAPFVASQPFTTATLVFIILFLLFVARTIVAHLLRSKTITGNELCGAMSVYIILGIVWAVLYILVEQVAPSSFEMKSGTLDNGTFMYFSFSTLTTMGYGDIIPVNRFVRVATILEAMTGVLYVAILIARLVSVYTQRQFEGG